MRFFAKESKIAEALTYLFSAIVVCVVIMLIVFIFDNIFSNEKQKINQPYKQQIEKLQRENTNLQYQLLKLQKQDTLIIEKIKVIYKTKQEKQKQILSNSCQENLDIFRQKMKEYEEDLSTDTIPNNIPS